MVDSIRFIKLQYYFGTAAYSNRKENSTLKLWMTDSIQAVFHSTELQVHVVAVLVYWNNLLLTYI